MAVVAAAAAGVSKKNGRNVSSGRRSAPLEVKIVFVSTVSDAGHDLPAAQPLAYKPAQLPTSPPAHPPTCSSTRPITSSRPST